MSPLPLFQPLQSSNVTFPAMPVGACPDHVPLSSPVVLEEVEARHYRFPPDEKPPDERKLGEGVEGLGVGVGALNPPLLLNAGGEEGFGVGGVENPPDERGDGEGDTPGSVGGVASLGAIGAGGKLGTRYGTAG